MGADLRAGFHFTAKELSQSFLSEQQQNSHQVSAAPGEQIITWSLKPFTTNIFRRPYSFQKTFLCILIEAVLYETETKTNRILGKATARGYTCS